MSNVLGFLEAMGQDAHLRHATPVEAQDALARLQIDPGVRAAMLLDDQSQLERLLGASSNLICGLTPAKDDEEGEDIPAQDDDEISGWRAFARVAAA